MAPVPVNARESRRRLAAALRSIVTGWVAAAYAGLGVVMRLIVRVYFRRLDTLHRERFPDRGAVLVVANHPSTWTDVLVLDVALGRRLHFLAEEGLYRPRMRGALLALFGSLPVVVRRDDLERVRRNAETFRRCHDLFDRGEGVAMFPEGVSLGDRSLQALKTGAARIVLGYDATGKKPLQLVPVGIHYTNRTAFRGDVLVHVGPPLGLEAYRHDPASRETAVQALTQRLQGELSELILDLPEPLRAVGVESLAPLLSRNHPGAAAAFERTRRLAVRLDDLRIVDPVRFAALCRANWKFHRACRALAVVPRAFDVSPSGWRSHLGRGLRMFAVLVGALPAALGAVVHAVPWLLSEVLAQRYAPEPSRIAFARIAAGVVLVPAAYLLFGLGLAWAGIRLILIPVVLVVAAGLGLWLLSYQGMARDLVAELRLLGHARRHPKLVERARATRRFLTSLLEDLLAQEESGRMAANDGGQP